MSFGALAAWQAWVLVAAAGGAAAWLFLLKLRPPRMLVPSLLLWRRVLDESRTLTLWERIRRAVSLAITVLVAMLLAFAFARPSRLNVAASSASRGRLLIVIDSSWSMLTKTRNGETRWDRARAEARRLAAAASGDDVALATTADGLVEGPTSDLALIETALDRLSPAGGEGTAWPRVAGTQVVHFITDGTIARPIEPGVEVDSVFEAASNVAITAFDVRPSLEAGHAGDAYLEIANFSPAAQKVRLRITRGAASLLDRQLDLGAGESARQVVPLAAGGDPLLGARVDAPENALAIDDEAFGWMTRARPIVVTVVGKQTAWLGGLLTKDPGVRATLIEPSAYHPDQGHEDVVIFDRWAPKDPPTRPALYFAPPSDTPWLAAPQQGDDTPKGDRVAAERDPRWEVVGDHPVVRGVDALTLAITRVHAYSASSLTPVAQSTTGLSLIDVDTSGGRRAVVVAFGPTESNLASAPGFPVLVGNALEWLARPDVPGSRKPGEVAFEDAVAKVTGPRGAEVRLQHVNHEALGTLRAPGIYVADAAGAHSTIAINVGDPQVSNVQRTSLGGGQTRAVAAGGSATAWWLYLAAGAFALILAEWWTWQRRVTV